MSEPDVQLTRRFWYVLTHNCETTEDVFDTVRALGQFVDAELRRAGLPGVKRGGLLVEHLARDRLRVVFELDGPIPAAETQRLADAVNAELS